MTSKARATEPGRQRVVAHPVHPPRGIHFFPLGVVCLIETGNTGAEAARITRVSGDEFEFQITPLCLDKAQQQHFPVRICKAVSVDEDVDLQGEVAPTKVKTEREVDVRGDTKHRVTVKDGETLKLGNTITYTAGANLITLDDSAGAGDSWVNAYTMADVLAAAGAVVTQQGANAYDVSARMYFAAGVYFKSTDEFVELRPSPSNPAYAIHQAAGAHVQFGEYNSTDKFSYNGSFWRIYIASTTGSSGSGGNAFYGELLIYGSNIWTDVTSYPRGLHYKAGATIRLYNSINKTKSYLWAVDTDIQDVKWYGGVGTYDMLIAAGPSHNWANLTTMDCNYGLFFSATTTSDVDVYAATILNSGTWDIFMSAGCQWLIRVINPTSVPVISGTGSGRPGCQVCYTFNVKVTDDTGAAITGATVSLKDVDGTDVFTAEDTVAGGVLAADKIAKTYWHRNAAQGGPKSYNPHTLKVISGADVTEYVLTIDHPISEDVVLLPQSTASYDNIMAGIDDIKGTGFVKDTDSLTDIRPETDRAATIQAKTDQLVFSGANVQARVADKGALNNPPSEVIGDYRATGYAVPGEYDGVLAAITSEVAGLDGAAMRGTNGANTTTPPTVGQIRTEMEAAGSVLAVAAGDVVGLGGDPMRGTNGANTVVPPTVEAIRGEMETPGGSLATVAADVDGLDGAAMRGTDGANMTTPPTVAQIRTEMEAAGTRLAAIQDQTDRIPADLPAVLARLLGYSQENFRLANPVYTIFGDLLTATIRIYANAATCLADTDPIAECVLAATYDSEGNCTSYTVSG